MTSKTFRFSNNGVLQLLDALQDCAELEEFNFDCCSIDWDVYLKKCVLGTQKYILKNEESSLHSAKRRLRMQVENIEYIVLILIIVICISDWMRLGVYITALDMHLLSLLCGQFYLSFE